MKPIYKLYLKSFVFTGIIYGMLNVVFDIMDGDEIQWGGILFKTLAFGVTMSLFFTNLQKAALKDMGIQTFTDENLSVFQSKKVVSPWNTSTLIEKLKADPVFRKMKMTETEDGVVLSTSLSWKSWGEKIKIKNLGPKANEFEYLVSSSPHLKLTVVDYGKSLVNVKSIEKVLSNPV